MQLRKLAFGSIALVAVLFGVVALSGNNASRAAMVDQRCGLLWQPNRCIAQVDCDCVDHHCTPWKDPNIHVWNYYPGTGYVITDDDDWCYRVKGCQPYTGLTCNTATNCVATSVVLEEYLGEGWKYLQPQTSCSD